MWPVKRMVKFSLKFHKFEKKDGSLTGNRTLLVLLLISSLWFIKTFKQKWKIRNTQNEWHLKSAVGEKGVHFKGSLNITLLNHSFMPESCSKLLVSDIKPLSANPTKWSNTLKQFVGCCRPIIWVCLTIL